MRKNPGRIMLKMEQELALDKQVTVFPSESHRNNFSNRARVADCSLIHSCFSFESAQLTSY